MSVHYGHLIRILHWCTDQMMTDALDKLDLTAAQGRLMAFLAHRGEQPTYAKDVEAEFHLSHPTVSGLLSRLEQKGFLEGEVTKGSGDYGVDILAEKDGVTYAIQCKRYEEAVGVKAVQEAYAGREYYDRMVGAVMTNQYFTEPAVQAAKKLKILLWDRGYMESMMEE